MRIVKPSYFQCPNDLIDHWMPLLKEGELRILLIVIRKTFGWNKDKDYIAYSLFEELSGMGRKAVVKAVHGLVEKNLIKKEITGLFGKEKIFYSLIVHEIEQQKIESDQYPKDTPPQSDQYPKDTGGVSLGYPQKTITKDNVVCSVCSAQGCEGSCKQQEPKPNHRSAICQRKTSRGEVYIASIQDVFGHAVKTRKNWNSNEIEQAWEIFEAYADDVNNYLNFIEGIINNIRQNKRNSYKNNQKQGRKCENTQTKQLNKPLPEKSAPITEGDDTSKQRWLDQLSRLGLKTT